MADRDTTNGDSDPMIRPRYSHLLGGQTTPTFQELIGHLPRPITAFLHEYRDKFTYLVCCRVEAWNSTTCSAVLRLG